LVPREVITHQIPEPCQNDIPLPDPFAPMTALDVPFPQGGYDLAMAHDFLKKQCFLHPVSLSHRFPSLADRQHAAVSLPTHEYSLSFLQSLANPPAVSQRSPAELLSETPTKGPSPDDNNSDTASSCRCFLTAFTITVLMAIRDD
jgi:hypothetical protein